VILNEACAISDLANMVSACSNRIFNPVRSGWNHFCFLTGHRTPVEVSSGENPLGTEDNPENTASITDQANQSSIDEKKACKFTQTLYGCGRIIRFVFEGAKNFLVLICRSSIKLISEINLWSHPK